MTTVENYPTDIGELKWGDAKWTRPTKLEIKEYEKTQILDALCIQHSFLHEISLRMHFHVQGMAVEDAWRIDDDLVADAEAHMKEMMMLNSTDKAIKARRQSMNQNTEPFEDQELTVVEENVMGARFAVMQSNKDVPIAEMLQIDDQTVEITDALLNFLRVINPDVENGLMTTAQNELMQQQIWGWQVNTCGWRLAIEALLAREFQLAAVLFETALYLDNPDMFLVFYPMDAEVSVKAIFQAIIDRCTTVQSLGRLWCYFYARVYLKDVTNFNQKMALSEPMTPDVVIALLGLSTSAPTHCEVGGVPYILDIELRQDKVTWGEGVESIVNERNRSFILASHAFRIAKKPYLMQAPSIDMKLAMKLATYTVAPPTQAINWIRDNIDSHFPGSSVTFTRKRSSVIDVVQYFNEHEEALDIKSGNKVEYLNCRYQSYSTLGEKPWYWRMLPANVKGIVLAEHACNTDFYSTIEYGRLCTLFVARDALKMGFSKTAQIMLNEEREIETQSADFVGLKPKNGSWKDGTSHGIRNRRWHLGNNFSNPLAPQSTCNTYLTYLINSKVFPGGRSNRCMISMYSTEHCPLLVFARFQQVAFQGTGTVFCPHVGWHSASSQACMADVIHMYPGTYVPTTLTFLCGADDSHPVTFQPFAYEEGKTPCNDASQCHVVISGFTIANETPKDCVLMLKNCSFLNFVGLQFQGGKLGSDCLTSNNIVFDTCTFDTDRDIVCDVSNNVTKSNCLLNGKGGSVIDMILHPVFPKWARWIGYLVAAGIYILLVFMCLFLTAGFDQATADEWVWRCAISVTVNVILIRPIMVCFMHCFEGIKTISAISTDLNFGLN